MKIGDRVQYTKTTSFLGKALPFILTEYGKIERLEYEFVVARFPNGRIVSMAKKNVKLLRRIEIDYNYE